jgi:hypothetical protein
MLEMKRKIEEGGRCCRHFVALVLVCNSSLHSPCLLPKAVVIPTEEDTNSRVTIFCSIPVENPCSKVRRPQKRLAPQYNRSVGYPPGYTNNRKRS